VKAIKALGVRGGSSTTSIRSYIEDNNGGKVSHRSDFG
jgi:hypothetical protein